MWYEIVFSILIPFLGTILGASCVFFMKGPMKSNTQKASNIFFINPPHLYWMRISVWSSIWSGENCLTSSSMRSITLLDSRP